jgi:hypothetical protein
MCSEDYTPIVDECFQNYANVSALSNLPEIVRQELAELGLEVAAECSSERRQYQHELHVRRARVLFCRCCVNQEPCELWLVGEDQHVYAPLSPATRRAEGLLSEAIANWEAGNVRAASASYQKALECATTDAGCHETLKRWEGEIPWELRVWSVFRRSIDAIGGWKVVFAIAATLGGVIVIGIGLAILLMFR